MPTPRSLNTVEFGWNGTDGYVKNDGKYQLLYTKPNLSFPYGVATYSSDPTVADIVLDQYGDLMEVTPEMEAEMSQYAVTNAVNEPWNTPQSRNYVVNVEPVDNLPNDENNRRLQLTLADGTTQLTDVVLEGAMPALIQLKDNDPITTFEIITTPFA
ncbi:putative lysis protein [Vibrio phage 4141]|uniref:Uncharacterized protein n=3 Tax=Chatterjeevirus TaxID=2732679 RepID=D0Q1C6_9CAUD|nr:hypothetical protein VN4_42 [Vibrio phage N4]ACR16507.1 hypothetical protein VN4_42 [Vibrio phage N4]